MSYLSPEEVEKIKEEQRIRTSTSIKTVIKTYFGCLGKVVGFTCLGFTVLGIIIAIVAGFIAWTNQAQQTRQARLQATSYARGVQGTQLANQLNTQVAHYQKETQVVLGGTATAVVLKATDAMLMPPKYEVTGKWLWNVAQWSGDFTIALSGNRITGTLEDTSVNLLNEKIIDGFVSDTYMEFTRSGYYGLQKWSGTLSEKDGIITWQGVCEGAGNMVAIKQ